MGRGRSSFRPKDAEKLCKATLAAGLQPTKLEAEQDKLTVYFTAKPTDDDDTKPETPEDLRKLI